MQARTEAPRPANGVPSGRPAMRAMPFADVPTQCARARGTCIGRNAAPGAGGSAAFDHLVTAATAGSALPAARHRSLTRAALRPLH